MKRAISAETLDRATAIRSALRTLGKIRVRRGARVFEEHPDNAYFWPKPGDLGRLRVQECFVGYMALGERPRFSDYFTAKEHSPTVRRALVVVNDAYEDPDHRVTLKQLVDDYLKGGK